jgi:hypothetical protein
MLDKKETFAIAVKHELFWEREILICQIPVSFQESIT